MSQTQTVGGRRFWILWLAVILILVLAVGVAAMVFVIGPQQQLRQQTQATAEARQAQAEETAAAHQTEVERRYQAGIAFQNAGDCAKAAESLSQVIDMEPSYKDAQDRLAEARACRQAAAATSTAQAIAVAEATTEAQAAATVEARTVAETNAATATAVAQANAAAATTEAAAAIETAYQRGVGYYNLERWAEAKAAFEEVVAVDPTYKDVQTMLPEVEAQLAEAQKLTPTALPSPRVEGPPWWDASYASRQQLTIGNNADGPLPAGYSVKLSFTGEKATDFFRQSVSTQPGDDVRIVYWSENQWQEIDRHVEAFTSSEVQIWFVTQDEVPPNGTSESYWVYFDNPEPVEPPAEVQEIFLWWDDFSLNTVSKYTAFRSEREGNSLRWSRGAISYDEIRERVSITAGDQIGVFMQPPVSGRNLVIEGDLYLTRVFPDSGVYMAFVRVVDVNNHYIVSFPVSVYDVRVFKRDKGREMEIANAGKLAYPLDTWHHIAMSAYEDQIEAWMDGTQIATTDAVFREGGVGIGMSQAGGYIDNIRVRKFVSPEPSVFLVPAVESQ